jgi:hypothetical protein
MENSRLKEKELQCSKQVAKRTKDKSSSATSVIRIFLPSVIFETA